MKLYYHKTDGGAEYLFDTFIVCPSGHKEGNLNDKTKYVVRIDGDITKDAELMIKEDNFICPNCKKERINDFPISDETGNKYCPDCNSDI